MKLWERNCGLFLAPLCAEDIENVIITSLPNVISQEYLIRKKPQSLAYLIQGDIISIVAIRTKINGKWREQGIK
jgi:hypothetical protein